jgi:hypothetical protein
MLSSIQYLNVIISMKGCEIDPCDSYVDNPLVSEDVLYDGPFRPTITPGSSGVSETFVSEILNKKKLVYSHKFFCLDC